MSEHTLEIVIPSYQRTAILKHTVAQIRVLYPDVPICLGLQEEIRDVDFRKHIAVDGNLRVVQMAEPSTTRTLNQCIESSNAEIVLILDDDAVPFFGWLEAHGKAFSSDPTLLYTCGREVRATQGRSGGSEWFRILVERLWRLFLANDKSLRGRVIGWTSRSGLIFGNFDQPGTCLINSPRGCNMAVRKDAFLAVGGFNPDFRGNAWGFEAEFGLRSARSGRLGRYIGDAMAIHYETSTGGSRTANRSKWFADYLHNHRLLMDQLGALGWIGALPRLIKKLPSHLIDTLRTR